MSARRTCLTHRLVANPLSHGWAHFFFSSPSQFSTSVMATFG